MGERLRTMVMKRKALCELVIGAVQVQGQGVSDSLGEYLSPVLEEAETLPDLAVLIELYGRKLQGVCDSMVAADEKYLAEIARLDQVEAESKAPVRQAKDQILSLRYTCRGLIGEESLRPLGLDFNLAQDLRGVLRQAEIIRERVASSESELVPLRWVDGTIGRDNAVQEFDSEIEVLRTALAREVKQRKRVDTAKVRKDDALKEFDRQYIPIVRLLEATFRVAGEADLADRIRPTVRQLKRRQKEEEQETASLEASTSESSKATKSKSTVSSTSDSKNASVSSDLQAS